MSCSESVKKVVEIYVESMKESSADKVREAFHPNAKVVGHLHGDFLEMSTEDFAEFWILERLTNHLIDFKSSRYLAC